MTVKELTIEPAQEMIVEDDTLIITDPCYLIRDEHWQHYCNMEFGSNPIGLDNYLRKYLNFGEVIALDTGLGDWSNEVLNVETKEVLGEFGADSGMVAVFTASDLSNYNVDMDEVKRLHDIGCLAIVPNFTGHIVAEYESSEDEYKGQKYTNRFCVIYGTSDDEQFGFTTLRTKDFEED